MVQLRNHAFLRLKRLRPRTFSRDTSMNRGVNENRRSSHYPPMNRRANEAAAGWRANSRPASKPVAFALGFIGLALVLSITSCRSPLPAISLHRYEFSSPHMGTMFTVTLYAPDPDQAKT